MGGRAVAALLGAEKVPVTPEMKDAVWSALQNLASAPEAERTMTGLSLLLQSNRLRTAIQPYTLDGPHGRLLDASESGFTVNAVPLPPCVLEGRRGVRALIGREDAGAMTLPYDDAGTSGVQRFEVFTGAIGGVTGHGR